ncbi:hypothetical protein HKX48_004974 [Thoreauomyces humboldtii]|nr:hypothetical protein HKX48_004974 [Thoreauomyces humboldtii]
MSWAQRASTPQRAANQTRATTIAQARDEAITDPEPNFNDVPTKSEYADGTNNLIVGKTASGSLTTPGKIVGDLDRVVSIPEAELRK